MGSGFGFGFGLDASQPQEKVWPATLGLSLAPTLEPCPLPQPHTLAPTRSLPPTYPNPLPEGLLDPTPYPYNQVRPATTHSMSLTGGRGPGEFNLDKHGVQ